jgi:predicted nucleic acid-binding protein
LSVVLDASAAYSLCVDPDGYERLPDLSPMAPALLWSEFFALVGQQRWRGQISPDVAAQLADRFLAVEIVRVSSDELYVAAFEVAAQLGWAKTYDAEYVALAKLTDNPLVTLDGRLRRGASQLVTVLTPDEALS